MNTLCGQNSALLFVKTGDTHTGCTIWNASQQHTHSTVLKLSITPHPPRAIDSPNLTRNARVNWGKWAVSMWYTDNVQWRGFVTTVMQRECARWWVYTCVLKVIGSNLDQVTTYLDRGYLWFCWSHKENTGTVASIRWQTPSRSAPTHRSSPCSHCIR
jgi:hypothetical protein